MADVEVTPISRTVGQGRIVDELIIGFTHDREMDAILPGIKPTGQWVELPHVVVVGLEEGKVAYEHIYWDQGSALYQLGLLSESLPVVGAEAAQRLRDPRSVPANRLMARWVESEGKDLSLLSRNRERRVGKLFDLASQDTEIINYCYVTR